MKVIKKLLTSHDLAALRSLAKTCLHHEAKDRGTFSCGTVYASGGVFYGNHDRTRTVSNDLYQKFMTASGLPKPFNGADVHQFISYKTGGKNTPHKDWIYDTNFQRSLRTDEDKASKIASKLYRVIALVNTCAKGGELFVDGKEVVLNEGDAVAFQSGLIEHEVKTVVEGDRMVFTIGFHHHREEATT